MKQTLKDYIIAHSAKGVWTGGIENGVPVVRHQGVIKPVKPFLDELGIKLADSNKYTERKENAGMGETQRSGDTANAGDGISQEQE